MPEASPQTKRKSTRGQYKKVMVEGAYDRHLRWLLHEWYVRRKKSSYEIAEKIYREKGIRISPKQVRVWVIEHGFGRTLIQALRNRIRTGRMNYRKRKFDYKGRKRDYMKTVTKNSGYAVGLRYAMLATFTPARMLGKQTGCETTQVRLWKLLLRKTSEQNQHKLSIFFGLPISSLFSAERVKQRKRGYDHRSTKLYQKIHSQLEKNGYRYVRIDDPFFLGSKESHIKILAANYRIKPSVIGRWLLGSALISPVRFKQLESLLGSLVVERYEK